MICVRSIVEGKESLLNFEKTEAEDKDKYSVKMRKDDLHSHTTFICRVDFNEIDYEMKESVLYEDTHIKYSFQPEKIIKLFNVFLKSYNYFVKFYYE